MSYKQQMTQYKCFECGCEYLVEADIGLARLPCPNCRVKNEPNASAEVEVRLTSEPRYT